MKKITLLLSSMLLALAGCSNNSSGKLKIATTFAPLYDFTMRIVKNKVDVICIAGNDDIHGFSNVSVENAAFTEEASLLVAYGHSLDTWSINLNKDKYFEATKDIKFMKDGNKEDPHAWVSLINAQVMLKNIYDKVVEIDSANKDFYTDNYNEAKKEFSTLNESYKIKLASVKSKKIVSSHDAFSYLAKDYNLDVKGIADSLDNEPTSSDVQDMIKYIKENDIHTIFVEELSAGDYVDTVINELKKDNYTVTAQTLSAYEGVDVNKWEDGDNYLKVMNDNLNTIYEVLK